MDNVGMSGPGWRLLAALVALVAAMAGLARALGQPEPDGVTGHTGPTATHSEVGEWEEATTPVAERSGEVTDEGIDLTERRCWEGVTDACVGLGDRFLWGRGVAADPAAASLYYTRACWLLGVERVRVERRGVEGKVDADSIGALTGPGRWACHQLALMYDTGWGVPRDRELAVVHARRACQAGLAVACDLLDGLYDLGQ